MNSEQAFRVELKHDALGGDITVHGWQSAGASWQTPLPMLLILDGTDFIDCAKLFDWLDERVRFGHLTPLRVAAVDPVSPRRRIGNFNANAAYSRMLACDLIPWLRHCPTTKLVGIGASMGAIAMLDLHCRYPGSLQAAIVQSGPFLRDCDPHASALDGDGSIRWAAADLNERLAHAPRIRISQTCGHENNLASNGVLHERLTSLKYPATWLGPRGRHDWCDWRDLWLPAGLADLIR